MIKGAVSLKKEKYPAYVITKYIINILVVYQKNIYLSLFYVGVFNSAYTKNTEVCEPNV